MAGFSPVIQNKRRVSRLSVPGGEDFGYFAENDSDFRLFPWKFFRHDADAITRRVMTIHEIAAVSQLRIPGGEEERLLRPTNGAPTSPFPWKLFCVFGAFDFGLASRSCAVRRQPSFALRATEGSLSSCAAKAGGEEFGYFACPDQCLALRDRTHPLEG